MDADGDGVGDFKGLMRRLDYLQGLGVTALWLMPFQPSPGRDGGYDVADYYNVDPKYGTLGDFVEFTHGWKQRGMRVLIDLVVNHTSNEHPGFARPGTTRNPGTETGTSGQRRNQSMPEMVLFSRASRSRHGLTIRVAKSWYFHRFYDFQPDLNTSHPEVQAEILKIMGFWLQLGVSGFRMDAVPFVIATKGPKVEEPVEQYDMLREFREFLTWREGDAIVLAEANVLPKTDMEYFGVSGERLQMMFNFQVNQNLFYALATADSRPLVKALKSTKPRPATAQWGHSFGTMTNLILGA